MFLSESVGPPLVCMARVTSVLNPLDVELSISVAECEEKTLVCRLYGVDRRGAGPEDCEVVYYLHKLLLEFSDNRSSVDGASGAVVLVKIRHRKDEIPVEGSKWSVEIMGMSDDGRRVSINEKLINSGHLTTWLESW